MSDLQNSILLSTAYLPSVEYFNYVISSSKQKIEKFETYKKQSYRNRCEILGTNGKLPLIIPINKPNGNHTKTNEITISYSENWQKIHWKSIESSYNSSPYFLYYKEELKQIFQKKHKYLIDNNNDFFLLICEFLDIDISIDFTTEFIKDPKDTLDLRNKFSPKIPSSEKNFIKYSQVFENKYKFIPNLSIIDLIFNLGPEAIDCLIVK